NVVTPHGESALLHATCLGSAELAALLLAAGADVNLRVPWRSMDALAQGYLESEVVRSVDRDGDAPSSPGLTPLIWAAYKGHADLVGLFLRAGADREAMTSDGRTALILAAKRD